MLPRPTLDVLKLGAGESTLTNVTVSAFDRLEAPRWQVKLFLTPLSGGAHSQCRAIQTGLSLPSGRKVTETAVELQRLAIELKALARTLCTRFPCQPQTVWPAFLYLHLCPPRCKLCGVVRMKIVRKRVSTRAQDASTSAHHDPSSGKSDVVNGKGVRDG